MRSTLSSEYFPMKLSSKDINSLPITNIDILYLKILSYRLI